MSAGRSVVDTAALVLERHQALEHEGVLIDAQTAGAIVTVHRALNPANRAKFEAMDAARAGAIAWKLVK
jgi:hypothetical protein